MTSARWLPEAIEEGFLDEMKGERVGRADEWRARGMSVGHEAKFYLDEPLTLLHSTISGRLECDQPCSHDNSNAI